MSPSCCILTWQKNKIAFYRFFYKDTDLIHEDPTVIIHGLLGPHFLLLSYWKLDSTYEFGAYTNIQTIERAEDSSGSGKKTLTTYKNIFSPVANYWSGNC
jgi:hypothetical protein